MDIALDEVLHFDAITSNASTGAAADADSTPSWACYEEDTDTAIQSGNFTKRTSLTGNYRASVTLSAANGFEVGKWYSIVASATVNSVAGKGVVKHFRVCAAEAVAGKPKADVDAFGGTAGTFSGGRPEVNATHLAGTAYASADFSTTMKASINTEADTALSDYGPLKPTTAGRTLDVSATGEAGIDLANVGSPTTTLNLSGTTISTSQAVASVSGAVGSVTGNVGGNVTGSVGSVATGGISATSFAAGAIDAAAIAANAIGASELAADAVAEIADAVWDEAISGHLTGGSTGNALNSAGSAGDPWGTSLPGAYSAGSAGYILGSYLTAAPPTAATIADAVHDEVMSGHAAAGTFGGQFASVYAALIGRSGGGSVNDASATTTSFKTTMTEVDDFWNDCIIRFTSGALSGQSRPILDFANTNGVVTLDEALTSAPANGVTFEILNSHMHPKSQIAAAVRTELATELARIDVASSTLATAANLATLTGYVDTEIAAILADTNELQTDWANGGRLDTILDARSSQTSVDDLPTNAELAAAITTALTTALTEGYRSTGATGSVRDLLYEILQNITEFGISGTTKTVKKLDGSTTAKTYTLDSSTDPTSITETT